MRQTMPHVYKILQHPKDKEYKNYLKKQPKKRLKNEMHTKCFEKV
jgi:hypothetical protein